MVVVGLTVIAAVVAPVLQWNDVPPDAVNVEEPPTQIAGFAGVMLHDGSGFTVTVVIACAVQPVPAVPIIVYVIVAPGLAITLAALVAFNPVEGDHV